MAQIQPRTNGRKAARYGIPAAVAGVAALTVGLVPALASSGNPDLPKISAQELVEKMAASETQHMSGTVKITTDLGLPELPGMGGSGKQGGGLFGDSPRGGEHGGAAQKSGVGPQKKLMELAQGEHTLRVAADGPDKQRVSIVEDTSEYSLIHNGDEMWAYDSGTDSAYHATAPAGAADEHGKGDRSGKHFGKGGGPQDITPQKIAEQVLKVSQDTTSVSVDGTAKVAGRDAYQLLIKPKGAPHSTVESVRIAVDAENGTPLKFTLDPKSGGKPAVEVAYTKVDFGKPAAETFRFKPPKGTDVVEDDGKRDEHHGEKSRKELGKKHGKKLDELRDKGARPGSSGPETIGKGWGQVVELKGSEGSSSGLPGLSGSGGQGSQDGKGGQGADFLGSFTEEAKGDFGTGRVFSTRLVNALMTEDGTVYVGAVTKEGLIKAANSAAE